MNRSRSSEDVGSFCEIGSKSPFLFTISILVVVFSDSRSSDSRCSMEMEKGSRNFALDVKAVFDVLSMRSMDLSSRVCTANANTVASKLFAPTFFQKCLKSQIIKVQLSCQFTTGMFLRTFTYVLIYVDF